MFSLTYSSGVDGMFAAAKDANSIKDARARVVEVPPSFGNSKSHVQNYSTGNSLLHERLIYTHQHHIIHRALQQALLELRVIRQVELPLLLEIGHRLLQHLHV